MIVGTAAARRATLPRAADGAAQPVYFHGETAPGTFWRCIGVLEAGGITISESLGRRLFRQLTLEDLSKPGSPRPFDEGSFPIRLGEFRYIHGYQPTITAGISSIQARMLHYAIVSLLSQGIHLVSNLQGTEEAILFSQYQESLFRDLVYGGPGSDLTAFGFLDQRGMELLLRDIREVMSRIVRGQIDQFDIERLERVIREVRHYYLYEMRFSRNEMGYFLEDSLRAIERLYKQFRNAVERPNSRTRPRSPVRPRLPD